MTRTQSKMALLVTAGALFLSRNASAQVSEIHGHPVTCMDVPQFDRLLNARDVEYFKDWTPQDYRAAANWLNSCRPGFGLWGNREAEQNQKIRFQILDEMPALVAASEHEKQQRIAQAAQAQAEEVAQRDQRELDQLRQSHQHCSQTGRRVRVFINDNTRRVTCSRAPAQLLNTILFLDERCTLPIAGAAHMKRAWMAYGAYQVGCWYETVDDGFIFVGAIPSLTHKSDVSWKSFPEAALQPDGSVTITEKDFDSKTFMSGVENARVMDVFKHTNEKP